MKKFTRLPPEARKQEIRQAALALFTEKGFGATTMENIVQRVSLSKGGVYRLYPSTQAILTDLILEGMHLRNAFYEDRVRQETGRGTGLSLHALVEMIADSLLLYPEISGIYVEFLLEKRRNTQLEQLYQQISRRSLEETRALIQAFGAEDLLMNAGRLKKLEDLMNGSILAIQVLGLSQDFLRDRGRMIRVFEAYLKE